MRRPTKLVVTTALATALVGGTIGVGPASAAGNKKKFCALAAEVGTDVTESTTELAEENAAKLQKSFKKLAKPAPTKKLKRAVKKIAEFYGRIADGEDPADLDREFAEEYAEATAQLGVYLATECITEVIPDITLPGGGEVDITLPEGIPSLDDLPGG